MTVANTPPRIQYSYSGPGQYDFNFQAYLESDIHAVYTDTLGVQTPLVRGSDFEVTLNTDFSGGNIVTTNPSNTYGTLLVYREVPYAQEVNWVNNNPFDMEIQERSFDRVVMMIQQLNAVIQAGNALSNWKGDWITNYVYKLSDVIAGPNSSIYICEENHTSGVWDADLANGKWSLMIDVSSVAAYTAEAKQYRDEALVYKNEAQVAANSAANSAAVCASIEATLNQCAEDIVP